MSANKTIRFREFSATTKADFLEKRFSGRHFFPHNVHFLPKCGPDGFKAANKILSSGSVLPNQLWQVILYTSIADEFPDDLFFDDDIVWHQQHLGKKGQVATANLIVQGDKLYGNNYLSDLVQRISRNKQYKSRIENRFKGWPYLIINSILNFALENGIKQFYSPTADFALRQTDPSRIVQRPLFDRIYDQVISQHYTVQKQGNWWKLDIQDNRGRIITGTKKEEILPDQKVICISHDIERGLGHIGIDKELTAFADKNASFFLTEMLAIEKEMKVTASYNIVGEILQDIRDQIEQERHCLSFHSFNHKVTKVWVFLKNHPKILKKILLLTAQMKGKRISSQLGSCRQIDYRLKGYRAPQSVLTSELSDENLCFHNFEWLGYYFPMTVRPLPILENRIVKIPIQFDDYRMYANQVSFPEWETAALQKIAENDLLVIGLHDCYASYWLPYYKIFLDKIRKLGQLKTLNEVASEVYLTNGI